MSQDYYLKQQRKLERSHRRMMEIGKPFLAESLGEVRAAEIIETSTIEYGKLLPEIPYIGGRENPLTDTLVQMVSMLALYRAARDHMPLDRIGELTRRMAQAWIERFPQGFRHIIGRYYLSRWMQGRKKAQALDSQKRRHPGDFVFEYVAGDGEDFDWGINYLDCAIVKFFAAQDAGELTPYMCQIDYLMFPALGITLKRTGTRASGCSHCDFRFRWGGAAAGRDSQGLLEIE